jgi:two-component sensor histidine kinase
MAASLQFVSIIVFTLGAPAFSVLALIYLLQRKRGNGLFRLFTVLCAFAFLGNIVAASFAINSQFVTTARALIAGILPPMMAHLIVQQEREHGKRAFVRPFLWLFYAAPILAEAAAQSPWSRFFDFSSQIILGATSAFSLALLIFTRRARDRAERRQRIWNLVLFGLLLLSAGAAFASDNPIFALLPDYVLLLFFAVRLYYTERLTFFDTFVRGGSFFAVGVTLIALLLQAIPSFANVFATDWTHACLAILALMPIWIVGPFLYRRVARWMDYMLGRKYSAIEAERLFMQAAQAGMSEAQLQSAAEQSLQNIFRCHAEVVFHARSFTASPEDLVYELAPEGAIRLLARDNQIPFLSADRRLLDTLATTLGVLLQNAQLRSQQERQLLREQELAALASRAELRALRAQINPHFLFNALNAIAGWIRTEPEFADETVAQLAEVFRYTLQRSQIEWVQVREEMDFIRSYLAVERARFRDRLEIEIEVEPAVNSLQIPAMMIQPLVENAIKHGASQVTTKGQVKVTIYRDACVIHIEVTDNGPGFPPAFILESAGSGHGLWNVSERLKGYYPGQGNLRWKSGLMGTCVTLELGVREES